MFGYVVTNKPELKIREFEEYRSYYCGLCKVIRKRYGLFGRLALNYDITFLYLILSSLYEPEICICENRCIYHHFLKQKETFSCIADYAADMNILLAYFKCLDDWTDDKNIFKLIYSKILKRKLRKNNIFNEKAERIKAYFDENLENEKNGNLNIEERSIVFGNIMGEVFSMEDDLWKENMSKCGFYLGKYIYILDAYDDLEKDIKKKSFNPLLDIYKEDNFEEKVKSMLTINAARCSEYFEKLPLIDNVEIMRNILYAGIWTLYDKVKEKKANGPV